MVVTFGRGGFVWGLESAPDGGATDEPQTASLSDQRVLAECGQSGLEMRRLACDLLGDALARVDIERFERHRRRDRMRGSILRLPSGQMGPLPLRVERWSKLPSP